LTMYHISIYDTYMPHLSQKELDPKTKKEIIQTFEMVLGKLNKSEAKEFLFSILSSTERTMLAKRLGVVTLLQEGVEDVDISEALGVTRTTINRMQLFLNLRPRGFEIAKKKINEDKMMQVLKKNLVSLASYALSASSGRVKF